MAQPTTSTPWLIIAVAAIAVGFLTYQSSQRPSAILDHNSFRLVSYNDTAIPSDQEYVLSFENGRLHTQFCNIMGGDYTVSGGTIKALVVSTLMYCEQPAGLMDIESDFSRIINDGANFIRTEAGFELVQGDAKFVYELQDR